MPRPPKIRTYEFFCHSCGKTYIEQDVEQEEEYPRQCSNCLVNGVVSYQTRTEI